MSQNQGHIRVRIDWQGHEWKAMIDTGAEASYIAPRLMNDHNIPWQEKAAPYILRNFEGLQAEYDDGWVRRETRTLDLRVRGKEVKTVLDIMDIGDDDVILGLPWLREHNPRIDWVTGQLLWDEGTHQQDTAIKTLGAFTQEEQEDLRHVPTQYHQYANVWKHQHDTGLPEHGPYDHQIPLKEGTQPKY